MSADMDMGHDRAHATPERTISRNGVFEHSMRAKVEVPEKRVAHGSDPETGTTASGPPSKAVSHCIDGTCVWMSTFVSLSSPEQSQVTIHNSMVIGILAALNPSSNPESIRAKNHFSEILTTDPLLRPLRI
jgi:hypothetical protein